MNVEVNKDGQAVRARLGIAHRSDTPGLSFLNCVRLLQRNLPPENAQYGIPRPTGHGRFGIRKRLFSYVLIGYSVS